MRTTRVDSTVVCEPRRRGYAVIVASVMTQRARWLICGLAGVILLQSGCQSVQQDPSRAVAERFAAVLEASSPSDVTQYLTPQAEVYLQGAQSSMSVALVVLTVTIVGRTLSRAAASSRYSSTSGRSWAVDRARRARHRGSAAGG
jgi:hypothetical protein